MIPSKDIYVDLMTKVRQLVDEAEAEINQHLPGGKENENNMG